MNDLALSASNMWFPLRQKHHFESKKNQKARFFKSASNIRYNRAHNCKSFELTIPRLPQNAVRTNKYETKRHRKQNKPKRHPKGDTEEKTPPLWDSKGVLKILVSTVSSIESSPKLT